MLEILVLKVLVMLFYFLLIEVGLKLLLLRFGFCFMGLEGWAGLVTTVWGCVMSEYCYFGLFLIITITNTILIPTFTLPNNHRLPQYLIKIILLLFLFFFIYFYNLLIKILSYLFFLIHNHLLIFHCLFVLFLYFL